MKLTDLSVLRPERTTKELDAIAVLQSSMPERLVRFADEYLTHLDAARAADACGASGQERTLMADRRVLTYIGLRCGHMRESNAELRSGLVRMLAQMALYDVKDALGVGGWLPLDQWPDQLRMCVEGFELDTNGAIKRVKFIRRLDVVKLLLDLTGGAAAPVQARHARVVFEQEV